MIGKTSGTGGGLGSVNEIFSDLVLVLKIKHDPPVLSTNFV